MAFDTSLPNGVFTATLTPLNNDLSVNHKKLNQHIHWLIDQGSDGIALLGTTGEANSFSIAERKEIIDRVFASGISPQRILVGTGCCAISDTVELTKHALKYRAGGILMLPPFYYKQVDEKGLLEYFDRVIEEIADDKLKIYLYHFPKMSGIFMNIDFIGKLIEKYPQFIVGMKDSSGDFENMRSVLQAFPGFKLYSGTEKYLLDLLKIGGAGCISASVNANVNLAAQVYNNRNNENIAINLQNRLTAVRSVFDGHPFVAILKQYFAYMQNDPSWLHLRPPNSLVAEEQLQKIVKELEAINFQM